MSEPASSCIACGAVHGDLRVRPLTGGSGPAAPRADDPLQLWREANLATDGGTQVIAEYLEVLAVVN